MKDIITSIKFIVEGIFEHLPVKTCLSVVVTALSYLMGGEHLELVNLLLILVVVDFVTGIMAAKKTGEVISSHKSLRSATKIVVYSLFIVAAHLSENILPGETYFEHVVVSFLALTEFISVIENIGKQGFAIPKKLLNKLEEYRDLQ